MGRVGFGRDVRAEEPGDRRAGRDLHQERRGGRRSRGRGGGEGVQNAGGSIPAPKRGEILFKAAQLLVERKEQLAREMTEEMGKVLSEARGDVQEAIDMAFYMAGEGRRMFGQTVPSELPNKFAMSVRKPLGVCGMITPWNFPMAIPSWKIMPALIVTGNTVVFKPASYTPLLGDPLRRDPRGGRAARRRRQPRRSAPAARSATPIVEHPTCR